MRYSFFILLLIVVTSNSLFAQARYIIRSVVPDFKSCPRNTNSDLSFFDYIIDGDVQRIQFYDQSNSKPIADFNRIDSNAFFLLVYDSIGAIIGQGKTKITNTVSFIDTIPIINESGEIVRYEIQPYLRIEREGIWFEKDFESSFSLGKYVQSKKEGEWKIYDSRHNLSFHKFFNQGYLEKTELENKILLPHSESIKFFLRKWILTQTSDPQHTINLTSSDSISDKFPKYVLDLSTMNRFSHTIRNIDQEFTTTGTWALKNDILNLQEEKDKNKQYRFKVIFVNAEMLVLEILN